LGKEEGMKVNGDAIKDANYVQRARNTSIRGKR
jgi:hypothetical protein